MDEADAPGESARSADDNSQALLTALTTDHFVLQSAASTTVSEAVGRSALYLSALSAALIAIGFVAAKPDLLNVFLAIVLPTIFVLGVFTVVRLVDTGIQNLLNLAQIAHIRTYYATLSSAGPRFFPTPSATGDNDTALRSMGLKAGSPSGCSRPPA